MDEDRRHVPDYYQPDAPGGAAIAALRGQMVLEFGANWCGHCLVARPFVVRALADAPGIRRLRIERSTGSMRRTPPSMSRRRAAAERVQRMLPRPARRRA